MLISSPIQLDVKGHFFLQKFRGSCPQDHRHALFQIMRPIFQVIVDFFFFFQSLICFSSSFGQSLDAAIEHFRNDSKKRAMRANRSSGKS